MKTAGETLNLSLSALICLTVSGLFPLRMSETTSWLSISGKLLGFKLCSSIRNFKDNLLDRHLVPGYFDLHSP